MRYQTAGTFRDGRTSTRVKDLVDVAAISLLFPVQAGRLRAAIQESFAKRALQPPPSNLPPAPTQWTTNYRKLARDAGIDQDLNTGYEDARAFLDPVLGETVSPAAHWDPVTRVWAELRDQPG